MVLTAARDLVHAGWKLLHHPLYGNYRPHQQPYRSLILHFPSPTPSETGSDVQRISPDVMSLDLMEAALGIYQSGRVLIPAEAPASLRDACSLLDYELMRLPLEQSGWLEHALERSA